MEGADFVQESGPEREDLKIGLFAKLDAALPIETITAPGGSSGLLMTRVQSQCKQLERTLIGHPS